MNIKLPEDDFERAAALVQSGKLKGAIAKALQEHELTGSVTHEIVTPRGPMPQRSSPPRRLRSPAMVRLPRAS